MRYTGGGLIKNFITVKISTLRVNTTQMTRFNVFQTAMSIDMDDFVNYNFNSAIVLFYPLCSFSSIPLPFYYYFFFFYFSQYIYLHSFKVFQQIIFSIPYYRFDSHVVASIQGNSPYHPLVTANYGEIARTLDLMYGFIIVSSLSQTSILFWGQSEVSGCRYC